MDLAARLALGIVLLAAAAGKIRARRELPDLLAAYGVPVRVRSPFAAALVLMEAVLGALLVAGLFVRPAALAALGLGVAFTAVLARLRARGVHRLRCGCFGAKERSTGFLLARAIGFTGLAGFTAFAGELEVGSPSRDTLVLIALAVLASAVLVLGALVLALYRQVGVLTLRIGPRAALELAEEGPPVGEAAPPLAGLAEDGAELVAFFSPNCRLCRELAPAVRALEREGLPVHVVYEGEDGGAFADWNVPGSPFVVHLVDGTVAAKGLVNSLEQLDGLIALGTARATHGDAASDSPGTRSHVAA